MADKKIKIDLIDIPAGRLRDIDPDWAKTLAGMFKETGHKTPIDVEVTGDRFRLVAGGHRLEAAKILNWKQISCRILVPATDQPAEEMRLHEILENLGRKNFNALERCEALTELKRVYQTLHPQTKHGGDRKSHAAKKKTEDQVAIFAFCQNAADTTGLSRRSVELAVQIFEGLAPASREALKGTPFAEKQSDLKALAELDATAQAKVLDLVLGQEPKAGSIADAKFMVSGKKPESDGEKKLQRVRDILPKLSKAAKFTVFRAHKKEIIELVQREGWLDA
jgi:ParB family chromosome partitioning protein